MPRGVYERTPEHEANRLASMQTPEYRAKMSVAGKRRYARPGERAKQSAALMGRPVSAETRAKMSTTKRGQPVSSATRAAQLVAVTGVPVTHGDARADYLHPLYKTWTAMKQRVLNPNHDSYADYGGRGITIADEWLEWVPFRDYIDEHLGPRPEGMTLDRIDNDGPYAEGNIRWATAKTQNSNRRTRKAG